MPNITRRDAVLTGLGAAVAVPALTASASNATAKSNAPVRGKAISGAAKHKFEMNIEETRITLVGNQTFQTFAFGGQVPRSEEHTSELQSLMRMSYAVLCLKKQKYAQTINHYNDKQ